MTTRRDFLARALGGAAAALLARAPRLAALEATGGAPVTITIYKSPTCDCCTKWVAHLKANGFTTVVHDTPAIDDVKDMAGVPKALRSCHTAFVGRWVIEGHVPAADIRKLLASRPDVVGLAVPGMPQGAPGMETGRMDHYDVIAFDRAGGQRVFEAR